MFLQLSKNCFYIMSMFFRRETMYTCNYKIQSSLLDSDALFSIFIDIIYNTYTIFHQYQLPLCTILYSIKLYGNVVVHYTMLLYMCTF